MAPASTCALVIVLIGYNRKTSCHAAFFAMRRSLIPTGGFTRITRRLNSPLGGIQVQKQTKRPFEIDDIFRFSYATEARLSPDGSRLVYTLMRADESLDRQVSNLWLVDLETGGHHPADLRRLGGYIAGLVARWNGDRLPIGPGRQAPGLPDLPAGRRSTPADRACSGLRCAAGMVPRRREAGISAPLPQNRPTSLDPTG